MRSGARVTVIIPALNEDGAIGKVVDAIPDWVDRVIVADNGSTDRTAEVACAAGADVVREPRRGYGSACLAGIRAMGQTDVVVFLDGDYSDHPDEMGSLVDPVVRGDAEMVIGSRALGRRERGSLTVQQRFGNWLACLLIRLSWRVRYTDLGPFRAIRASALLAMGMRDRDYGWTVEMQVKAARDRLRTCEVPVSYRRRIGVSKVSGTIRGVFGAATKILGTILLAAFDPGRFAGAKPGECVIVYSRYPVPGRCKTRLIGALGADGAAALQRRMTEHAMRQVRLCARRRRASIEVHYAGGDGHGLRKWLGDDVGYHAQCDGEIGDRMARSLDDAFHRGASRAILVGTDCPGITRAILSDALDALDHTDVVFGPAADGGYYLVGIRRSVRRRAIPCMFERIHWSTSQVLDETLSVARDLGLRAAHVATLADVDRPEDIDVWRRIAPSDWGAPRNERISVVVASLNEESLLRNAISELVYKEDVEVIVVDGGSCDRTAEVARRLGAILLTCAGGRGTQFNAGAARAAGGALVFLHGDTRLPDDFATHVRATLRLPGVSAGAFELGIDAPGIAFRVIERGVSWRSHVLGRPYGDQALFMAAATFAEMGGFRRMALMEDCEMVCRLRRRGRIAIAPAKVTTSARRWLRLGVGRTTLLNQIIVAGHALGVSSVRLARLYNASREDTD